MRKFLAALAAFAVAAPVQSQAQDWYEAETAHFIIKSRDREENVREFAETMERFDRGMRFLQGLPENHIETSRANKPIVYRFGDYTDMSRWYGNSEAGVGGFFISRAGQSVAFAPARLPRSSNSRERRSRTDSVEQVLLHEYVHYFMHQNVPAAYPRWYSEGYAEMMSTMRFSDDGSFHIGDPPQSRGGFLNDFPMARLEEMLDSERVLTGYDAYQHYNTGWLFSHYMSFNPEREQRLRAFLVALGNGQDSLTSARNTIGNLDDLQRELVSYKRGPFPGYDVRPNMMVPPEVAVRPLTPAEVAVINEEMTLWRGVFSKEMSMDTARTLRATAARFPEDAQIQALLAEAEHDAGNYPAAAQAAERATELDPENQHAWLYRAKVALEMAKDDETNYEVARGYLQKARNIDLDDPRPLILYYQSFYDETNGADIPELALVALEQAFTESGSDPLYRLTLGRQLVMEERYGEALVVMQPSLFSGHRIKADDDDFSPDGLIAAINGGDKAKALEMLSKLLDDEGEEEGA